MDVSSVHIYYVPLVGKDRLSSAMSSWRLMSLGDLRYVLKCLWYKVECGEFCEKFKENKRNSSYSGEGD